jgi:hypothetical protein
MQSNWISIRSTSGLDKRARPFFNCTELNTEQPKIRLGKHKMRRKVGESSWEIDALFT